MPARTARIVALILSLLLLTTVGATERRPLGLDDLQSMRWVEDPRFSPDGSQVAYAVKRLDFDRDESDSDIWIASWDGTGQTRLTHSPKQETTPRFSPDGRYLAFLSSREYEAETDQLWLLPRAGGEARRVTDLAGGVTDYAWSPDGKRLVLVADDPDPDAEPGKTEKEKRPKPIVIDRYRFKQDRVGYLRDQRSHLYLLDLENETTEILTPGRHDEHLPAWSPDGRSIAFVTKRGEDPDRHNDWNVWVIEARPGGTARAVTTNPGADCDPQDDTRPAWSPDGKWIAYLHGGPQELLWYGVSQIGVIPSGGGEAILPTAGMDRNTHQPRWSEDGRSLLFLLEDDGERQLARVPFRGGEVERLTGAGEVVDGFDVGAGGRIALRSATPAEPHEIRALARAGSRSLSRQNERWLADVALGSMERIEYTSADGTPVHGWVVKPAGFDPERRYPTVLRIHGGPTAQYSHRFRFEWQLLAAQGYVVLGVNPRGSSGRGEAYARAIWADWGSVDVEDVLGAVDHAVARGWADPDRLGLGGWSYGGMLTNYTIARDTRFKVATSGSSIGNVFAGYGTDHYVREYEIELGRPWENLEAYVRNSRPFLEADRIVTPTLFLCGEKDVNVPLLASEQMYQALRSLEVETRLVIYPGQYHGIVRPSFQRDRYERYLAWYGRFLKDEGVDDPANGAR